jgi:hypothetical protein
MIHPDCFKRPSINDLKEKYEDALKSLIGSQNHTRHFIKKINRKTCKNKNNDD